MVELHELPADQEFRVFRTKEGVWIAEGRPADILAQAPTITMLGARLDVAIQAEEMEAKKRGIAIPRRRD